MNITLGNILFLSILLYSSSNTFGRDAYKQYHTDFLAHETGGVNTAWSKQNNFAPNGPQITQSKQEYDVQFPSLGSPTQNPSTRVTSTTPKNRPTGLRDYVAPHLPSQQPTLVHSTANPVPPNQPPNQKNHPSGGKRDYINPQFTTLKPEHGNSGKVKDLINFFDDKSKDHNGPNKNPSPSNISQVNKLSNHHPSPTVPTRQVQYTTPKINPSQNTSPISFSSIVSGNKNKISTSAVTTRPTTHSSSNSVQNHGNTSPTSQKNPVLPSSIVNNKNNQGNNNNPTDDEIQTLSEELLKKDVNNAAKYVTINYQQKTSSQSSEDKAPLPLLSISSEAWNIPTVQKLMPLLDNYERDTSINEHVTPQERNEENAFMDEIMNTAVIRHLMSFLKDKGFVSPDPKLQRDFLKQLWFNLYSRGKGKISSSGFEHVFVSELKNGDVQGLHNWIYFSKEETANRVNYLGYLKYQPLGDKGAVLKLHFNQQGIDKPVDTIFIGTSPELEIALYTLCFVTRAGQDCPLKLTSKDVNIVTHNFRYRSKNYIGSAYPQI